MIKYDIIKMITISGQIIARLAGSGSAETC